VRPAKSKETIGNLNILSKLLSLDLETGDMVWTDIHHSVRHRSKVAGTKHNSGYTRIGVRIGGKLIYFLAHRVVFALHYGRWPDGFVDHINGVKTDNRISNLRDVDKGINAYNYPRQTPESGYRGVRRDSRYSHVKYYAFYAKKYLGVFETPEEAAKCYDKYVTSLYGDLKEVYSG
jgi:predicted DNA binding CopG/RHH family protein